MDIKRLTEIYGLTNLPEGEFEFTKTDIDAGFIDRLQSEYPLFDSARLAYAKKWAAAVGADPEASAAFSWLTLLLSKRVNCEHIKMTRTPTEEILQMAAYFSELYYMPRAMRYMHTRGVPDEVINNTVPDGFSGALKETDGGFFFDAMKLYSWIQLYIDSKLLRVGILNFELRDRVKEDCGGRLSPDDAVINVHIPAGIRLTPENCRSAYSECAKLVKTAFPEFKYKAFVCFSWMMDSQLKTMLSPESNIVKFQSHYETFSTNKPTDSVLMFVFGYPAGVKPHPSELAEDTSLQRAIKNHLLAGGQMYSDGGIFFDY